MRPDAERTRTRWGRLTTSVVGVLLALALALVAPAAGPVRDRAHDLVSVHLIFPHHHDAHLGHGPATDDGRVWDDDLRWFGQPAISSAGPLVDAASLAGNGLMLAGLAFALALQLRWRKVGLQMTTPRQRWDAVPIRPPR